jgi:hypothetical protein
MTMPYSLDLRRRVARCVEAGHSCHAAATSRSRSPLWSGSLDNLPAHKSKNAAQCLSKGVIGSCSFHPTVPI